MNNPKLKLKYYREIKGLSQTDLAKRIETTQGYISKVEKGIESPTVRMLYQFAHALEICPCLLLPCIIESKENFNYECELNLNDSSNL